MTNVKWVKYGAYAGCVIDGVAAVPKPVEALHMHRAYYLTALIEAPKYGAVQSYDGAAMSGGPLHNIAIYPRDMQQGSLFSLLRALEVAVSGSNALIRLWDAYTKEGWYVAQDGVLRHNKKGHPITGALIRDTFTPVNGKVPNKGTAWDSASRWAVAHHDVFSDPLTYEAQRSFAIDWLLKSQRQLESLFYGSIDPRQILVGSKNLSIEEDLALSAYHCYSVNAPAPARDDLSAALKLSKKGPLFARTLINQLANTTYGNWENRYTRTRNCAIDAGLWPQELFDGAKAIFPARERGIA